MEQPIGRESKQARLDGADNSHEPVQSTPDEDVVIETLRRFFPGIEVVEEDDIIVIRET